MDRIPNVSSVSFVPSCPNIQSMRRPSLQIKTNLSKDESLPTSGSWQDFGRRVFGVFQNFLTYFSRTKSRPTPLFGITEGNALIPVPFPLNEENVPSSWPTPSAPITISPQPKFPLYSPPSDFGSSPG